MFCKNCGNQIVEGDKFCGSCGHPAEGTNSSQTKSSVVNGGEVVKAIKTYFTKPLSFFSVFKGKELIKPSIGLFIGLPIIYGLLNMIYTSAILNSIFSLFKNLPDFMAKVGIISPAELATAKSEILLSDEFTKFKTKITALVDNKDIFLRNAGYLLIIIIVTAIIIFILNKLILKNSMKLDEILFVSTVSYAPLVLSILLASLVTLFSISFGLFILLSGYVLSFITLFSGINQLSESTNDKVFILMIILFIIVSAILSLCISKYIESSFMQIKTMMDSVDSFF